MVPTAVMVGQPLYVAAVAAAMIILNGLKLQCLFNVRLLLCYVLVLDGNVLVKFILTVLLLGPINN